jgi:hypothetical protein
MLSRKLPERTEENHIKIQTGRSLLKLGREEAISLTQARRVTTWINLFDYVESCESEAWELWEWSMRTVRVKIESCESEAWELWEWSMRAVRVKNENCESEAWELWEWSMRAVRVKHKNCESEAWELWEWSKGKETRMQRTVAWIMASF